MARFYANENLPEPVVVVLRRLGHDVLTMRESGHAGRSMPDTEVLDVATADSRAVVTLNRRHFVRLHADRPAHAGIVVCTSVHVVPGGGAANPGSGGRTARRGRV